MTTSVAALAKMESPVPPSPSVSGLSSESLLPLHANNEHSVEDLSQVQPPPHKRTFSEFCLLDRESSLPFRIKEENIRSVNHMRPLKDADVKSPSTLTNLEPPPNYAALAQSAALDVLNAISGTKSHQQTEHNNTPTYTMRSTHNSLVDDKMVKHDSTFECSVCGQGFKNATQLKNHFWRHTGVKPFKCEICQASFTQLANLKTHQRIHTGERPFDCTECGATFTQISNLKTHQKLHTGEKPYVCDICNAKFTQQSNLKSHRLIHTGERPYKCDMCDACFVQSTHLRNHKRIHTNERPYACEHCGASFRQLSNLKTHEKTHTGEKPFICDECGSCFAQKSNLKSHKLKLHQIDDEEPVTRRGRKASHGGVGPFICDECGAHFSAASNLKTHLRLHTGEKPFECSICFMSFAQKSNLKSHEMTHSDVKPYACPDCPSAFKQKTNLRTHIIKKHNGSTVNFSPFLPQLVSSPSHLSPSLLQLGAAISTPSSSAAAPSSSRPLVVPTIRPTHEKGFPSVESGKSIDEPIVQIKEGRVVVKGPTY